MPVRLGGLKWRHAPATATARRAPSRVTTPGGKDVRERTGRARLGLSGYREPTGEERVDAVADEFAEAAEEPDSAAEAPDVLLDVPRLDVEELNLEVDNLQARVSLRAEVLDLVKLHVGADVALDRVGLDLKGVEAQALLKVRLAKVAAIIERVLATIDDNPQIVERLVHGVESSVEDVGRSAAGAVESLDEGVSDAVEGVGRSAGAALEGVGEDVTDEATGMARSGRDERPRERPKGTDGPDRGRKAQRGAAEVEALAAVALSEHGFPSGAAGEPNEHAAARPGTVLR